MLELQWDLFCSNIYSCPTLLAAFTYTLNLYAQILLTRVKWSVGDGGGGTVDEIAGCVERKRVVYCQVCFVISI